MKKKLSIFIAIILLLVIYGICNNYGLFTSYNYFTAKRDIRQGKIRILLYGELQQWEPTDSVYIIASKNYGFEYDRVAGCAITTPQGNGIDSYNNCMMEYLDKRNGKNWREKLDSTIKEIIVKKDSSRSFKYKD